MWCSQGDASRDMMPRSLTQVSVVRELSPSVNTDSVLIRRTWQQPKVIRAGPLTPRGHATTKLSYGCDDCNNNLAYTSGHAQ